MSKPIMILSGPRLNRLGEREPFLQHSHITMALEAMAAPLARQAGTASA